MKGTYMNAAVETCDSETFHSSHYYEDKWCPGKYRELAAAVRAWKELSDSIKERNQ